MDGTALRRKISTLLDDDEPNDNATALEHRELFELFLEIEKWLGDVRNDAPDSHTEAETEADHMIEAQSRIMFAAAARKARTPRELLFKLALWRWDKTDVDSAIHDGRRADAIAYAVFRDLAEMTEEDSVLTTSDADSQYWLV